MAAVVGKFHPSRTVVRRRYVTICTCFGSDYRRVRHGHNDRMGRPCRTADRERPISVSHHRRKCRLDSGVHAARRFDRLPVHGPRGEQNWPQNHDARVDRTYTSRLDNDNMGPVRKYKYIFKKTRAPLPLH